MRGQNAGSDPGMNLEGIEAKVWEAVNNWTDIEFWGIKLTTAIRYDLQQVIYKLVEAEKEAPCDPV